MLRLMGVAARVVLGAGRVNLTGRTPNNQRFIANPRMLWSIAATRAIVDGIDIGAAGPIAGQASLGDFVIPQRGLFAVARTRLSVTHF